MKISLYKACHSFVKENIEDKAYWGYYVEKMAGRSCSEIQKYFGVYAHDDWAININAIYCKACLNKIVDIKDLKIKPEKMKEFLFWYIRKGFGK